MAEREETSTLTALGLTALGGHDTVITGLSVDSREVKPGHLFAAMPGARAHGAEFIEYAIRMGAAAILTDRAGTEVAAEALRGADVAVVVAENVRETLAMTAALWFGLQPETMVAITGTNGKTSVASFTRQLWQLLDFPAANIGTTGVEGDYTGPSGHTTPEPVTLHHMLRDMARAGITHAAMEASSHGLDQRRLDGVRLKAAGFTNFTQDHLDYHHTFEAYFEAKAGLFTRVLPEDATAVINTDGDKGYDLVELASARGQKVITLGRDEFCDLWIQGQRYDATGQEVRFTFNNDAYMTRLNLIGGFQAENVLLAAGLAIGAGAMPEAVFGALPGLVTVRGRMQHVATRDNGATVFVDYAHTPDAIATAIEALRPHVMGKIIAIIGAGGDRDTTKRPLMGKAAAENADIVIVTDDNPRSEDPSLIRAAVMEGCPEANEEPDRAVAILRGVDLLQPGDALLIMGKGHETGQVIGDDVLPFDDAEQASVAVAALEGKLT